jgi:hypothetical protein
MSRPITLFLMTVLICSVGGCERTPRSYRLEQAREIPLKLGSDMVVCNVFDMTMDEHGNFYLADRTCHSVWIVDANGNHLARIGGKAGRAPGELSAPTSVAIFGDTLLVLEAGNHRVSMFSRKGDYFFSFPLQAAGPPSGIEIGPQRKVIVSESLGMRNFDFYTLSGNLLTGDHPILPPPVVYAPVLLSGGHMSLSDDGYILFSYIREYSVVKLDWNGAKLQEFKASPPGYNAPELSSVEAAAGQMTWSVVGLPLQIENLIFVQWYKRRVQLDQRDKVEVDRFADLFTIEGKPIQLALPIPNVFLLAKNGLLYGVSTEPIRAGATNPSIVVYRLVAD